MTFIFKKWAESAVCWRLIRDQRRGFLQHINLFVCVFKKVTKRDECQSASSTFSLCSLRLSSSSSSLIKQHISSTHNAPLGQKQERGWFSAQISFHLHAEDLFWTGSELLLRFWTERRVFQQNKSAGLFFFVVISYWATLERRRVECRWYITL